MADPCSINIYPGGIRDILGNGIGFFINGTDEDVGVVSGAGLTADYIADTNSPDGTFRVLIEAVGVLKVQLADLTDFTVTLVQTTKYLGDWLPLNIRKVYHTDTTADFSVGW
jgi:hypothetical protein